MQPRTRFTLIDYLWVFGLVLLIQSLFFSAPAVSWGRVRPTPQGRR